MKTFYVEAMNEIFENLSHAMRGAAVMFYLMLSIRVFPERKESRLKSILFSSMLFLAFLMLKDMVLLNTEYYFNEFVINLLILTDYLYVPVMALFFFEAVSPGWVSPTRSVCFLLPFIAGILAYTVTGSGHVMTAMFPFALIFGLTVTIIILSAVSERDNKIKGYFSEVSDISVIWVKKAITALFINLALWTLLQWESTWAGDAAYFLVSIVVWAYIYNMAIQHKVVEIPACDDAATNREDKYEEGNIRPGLGEELRKSMEERELYLNPKITLADLAADIGTNRTYLSEYLNKSANMTFYEFVNGYRVKKSVEIMSESPKMTLMEIAEKSGFNSQSTFNRAFMKNIGMPPAKYQKTVCRNMQSAALPSGFRDGHLHQ